MSNLGEETQKDQIEQHFTVAEIADKWKLSDNTVRRIFRNEPGVIKIGQGSRLVGKRYKRRHFVLRVPQSVFLRVLDRMTKREPGLERHPANRLRLA